MLRTDIERHMSQSIQNNSMNFPAPTGTSNSASASTPTIENGVWYLDYESWTAPIPQGVNCVNIFVGKLDIVNGQYTIDGMGDINQSELQTFIQQCHAHNPPIAVKITLGGHGGDAAHDNTWDLLMNQDGTANEQAIQSFAAGMASFCKENGIDGIDFDYEEDTNDPSSQTMINQEAAVGQLIGEFKTQNPTLQTSLCTDASPYWQTPLKRIFDAAVASYSGACPIDRLYVMEYTDNLSTAEANVEGMAQWAHDNYGLSNAQISAGIDPTTTSYDYNQFAQWAASQGISSCMWYWNPADETDSNTYSNDIWNDYHPSHTPV